MLLSLTGLVLPYLSVVALSWRNIKAAVSNGEWGGSEFSAESCKKS